jgi:acetyl esterase/lipase
MGEAATWGGFASRVAVAGELRMVVPDYRLAPEHPFPAALSDLARIYQELRADTNGPILVGGDSAGGGLALSLALLIRDEGQLRRPDGLVLISPWVDLIPANDTYTLLARVDQVFSREAALEAAEFYLQGAPADAALASPVRANLERIAPVQIFAGGSEVLLGDSLSLAGRLAISGVSVDARIVAGMQHVWTLSGPSLPETAMVVDEIARWCRARGSDENALKSETQDAM